MPDYFTIHHLPRLRDPVLIAAFQGWNDASESASSAVRFMIEAWPAQRVASLDGEDFFDFTESRPHVRLVDGVTREIDWPSLDVFAYSDDALPHDLVFMVGPEPHLRWRTFTREVLGLLDELDVHQVVLLGALLADVPHTRPPRLIGSASTADLRERLEALDIVMSRYEGPTGIVGVLQDLCGRRGMPTASLWGHVPHYITASPNPQVSVALLHGVERLLDVRLNLRGLESQARRFRSRVDEAIAQSPEATSYVQELEEREEEEEGYPTRGGSSLPTGPEVVRALEEFLRQQRTDDEED